MPWNNVTLTHLEKAMDECDKIGLEKFRTAHGDFHVAHGQHMYFGSRGPYEARPLIAAAYCYLYPDRSNLAPNSFNGENGHHFLVDVHKFVMQAV